MIVDDLEGRHEVETEAELLTRLRTVRKDRFGAFVLSHDDAGLEKSPSLWIHTNGGSAYVHYFRDLSGKHPGFQPTQMTPPDCPDMVPFIQTSGSKADGFELPSDTLCTVDNAYQAAVEFLRTDAMPTCIHWFEL